MNNPAPLSACCKALVTDHLSQAYPERTADELRGKTNWYVCTKCGDACDLQPPAEDKQSDYVNPYTHIRSLETKLSVAVEALQHYANADAFGQCWHDGEEAKSALSKILPPTE